MNVEEWVPDWVMLLGIIVGSYVTVRVAMGGGMPALPAVSIPSIPMPSLGSNQAVLLGILGLGGVYAVATKRGWRADVRYLIQVVAIGLIAYLLGRAVGPMVWGVLPL